MSWQRLRGKQGHLDELYGFAAPPELEIVDLLLCAGTFSSNTRAVFALRGPLAQAKNLLVEIIRLWLSCTKTNTGTQPGGVVVQKMCSETVSWVQEAAQTPDFRGFLHQRASGQFGPIKKSLEKKNHVMKQ